MKIKPDIDPIHMEESGITIQLANKEYISPVGIVSSQDAFCPIIFGRPFLHTVGAEIVGNMP